MKKRLLPVITGLVAGTAVLVGSATAAWAGAQVVAADATGDGWNDTYFVDGNLDGWYELAAFDFNQDGWRDGIAADLDQNGVFELYFLDPNQNGYSELYAIDDNQDGFIDRAVRDANENGIEDSNETMMHTVAIVGGTPTYDGPAGAILSLSARTGIAVGPDRDLNDDGYDDY